MSDEPNFYDPNEPTRSWFCHDCLPYVWPKEWFADGKLIDNEQTRAVVESYAERTKGRRWIGFVRDPEPKD